MAKAEREAQIASTMGSGVSAAFRVLSKKDLAAYQRSHYNRHRFKNFIGVKGTNWTTPHERLCGILFVSSERQISPMVSNAPIDCPHEKGARLCAYCGCTLQPQADGPYDSAGARRRTFLRNIVIVCQTAISANTH